MRFCTLEYLELQKQWCFPIETASLAMGKFFSNGDIFDVFLRTISLFLIQWSFCYVNFQTKFNLRLLMGITLLSFPERFLSFSFQWSFSQFPLLSQHLIKIFPHHKAVGNGQKTPRTNPILNIVRIVNAVSVTLSCQIRGDFKEMK